MTFPAEFIGDAQPFVYGGMRVHLHPGELVTVVKPKWWDLLRRLGFVPKKITSSTIIEKGQVFILKEYGLIIMRNDDWPAMRKRCERIQ